MSVSPARRISRAISLGVFFAFGSLDHGDHAIEEGLSRIGTNLDDQPIGEHPGTPGHGATIASALPDHGSALSRDGALVYGGHPGDGVSVTWYELARGHQDEIPFAELRGRDIGDLGVT